MYIYMYICVYIYIYTHIYVYTHIQQSSVADRGYTKRCVVPLKGVRYVQI